jgi:diguanylate cyclase
METSLKNLPQMPASTASLRSVLTESEAIKDTVEEAADELSSVNEILKLDVKVDVPKEAIKQAIVQNSDVELKIAKAASDLDQVNDQLEKELADRAGVESELAETKSDLAEARLDLSISQAKEKAARKRSLQDPLTDLPNRALFDQSIEHGLIQAKRHGWNLAVMFLDIDKFKSINDTYGHDAGDKVLQMIARRLTTAFRAEDTVSRWGGDEFVCLLLEVKHQDDVVRLAELLIGQLAQPFLCNDVDLRIKASIGIALYPQHGTTAEALFKKADAAMYKAKSSIHRIVLHK